MIAHLPETLVQVCQIAHARDKQPAYTKLMTLRIFSITCIHGLILTLIHSIGCLKCKPTKKRKRMFI